ncbi:hypothetical protein [Aurantiacibacter zhengii]|uniref:CPBP family intramembrane metalloprotease n=1 Tax=Aurantiacibacter zhengii TaxID=2307003 RepID=A0A418NV63_9SPHN|nr:hypothetical protein [Aurantiacibacter zhengii]RIV87824.1 hypothetical protein D2V07_05740 [Aurantiacibacter zhengii]
MTLYLGIITAYGAVAVLAWLAALLYPRLIPATAPTFVDHRWKTAGLFALATAGMATLSFMAGRGFLVTGDSAAVAVLNQIVIFAPVIAYALYCRTPALVLVPRKNTARSLAIGLGIAILGLTAFYSSIGRWDDLPLLGSTVLSGEAISIAARSLLRCLFVGAFLALVAEGWSKRTALLLPGLAIALLQLPALFEDGFSAGWLGLLVAHVVLVAGLLSAILATRNIVWFWPVLAVLNMMQFSVMQDTVGPR